MGKTEDDDCTGSTHDTYTTPADSSKFRSAFGSLAVRMLERVLHMSTPDGRSTVHFDMYTLLESPKYFGANSESCERH